MIGPGDLFNCAVCERECAILSDADPETISLINEQYGEENLKFLCSDCANHIAGHSDNPRRLVVWTGKES